MYSSVNLRFITYARGKLSDLNLAFPISMIIDKFAESTIDWRGDEFVPPRRPTLDSQRNKHNDKNDLENSLLEIQSIKNKRNMKTQK